MGKDSFSDGKIPPSTHSPYRETNKGGRQAEACQAWRSLNIALRIHDRCSGFRSLACLTYLAAVSRVLRN